MMKNFLAVLTFLSVSVAQAGALKVKLVDNQALHLTNAVVYLETDEYKGQYEGDTMAIMDQINRQFSPYILAIQKGQKVSFPNSDSIKHHVYSFSPTKKFELQLFKNRRAQSMQFEKQGAVELGCNIHDWMLGYIFVVDTPYFAQTDKDGGVTIDAPDGDYTLRVWHPRIQEQDIEKKRPVSISGTQEVTIKLSETLAPGKDEFGGEADEFSEYD
ncbi:methylamine utilization protein [Alteromonas sp. a30]|uniref:methylamine utilization protein n=1 Tax=Alteromonas sp. a30 TaxID=2730917 RepID=UPI0022812D08|nr:methylamine utilization protein [Alteromonas sp. a30]MCY7296095.1 methylamine utilization protein [Alteromonas sp. a30]